MCTSFISCRTIYFRGGISPARLRWRYRVKVCEACYLWSRKLFFKTSTQRPRTNKHPRLLCRMLVGLSWSLNIITRFGSRTITLVSPSLSRAFMVATICKLYGYAHGRNSSPRKPALGGGNTSNQTSDRSESRAKPKPKRLGNTMSLPSELFPAPRGKCCYASRIFCL